MNPPFSGIISYFSSVALESGSSFCRNHCPRLLPSRERTTRTRHGRRARARKMLLGINALEEEVRRGMLRRPIIDSGAARSVCPPSYDGRTPRFSTGRIKCSGQ